MLFKVPVQSCENGPYQYLVCRLFLSVILCSLGFVHQIKFQLHKPLKTMSKEFYKFFTNLFIAIHGLSSVVVEELTFAIFQLVLLITHVLLDLCAVFLSPERKTLLVLQLNAVGESSLMKWVKVILD